MIITISRMFGSGGSDVAARVARQLGWSLLDNAVVDEVAERLGVSRSEVESLEERVPSLAERIASSLALEMAAHEEQERRALEGELAILEAAWREAEEVAKIADEMFLPENTEDRLGELRKGARATED